ncbi:MAG: hypothetical protein K6F51_08465 [Acetatifactor sp.]|nr:hypothetical protein [Acetatifactor sp.]
MQASKRNEEYLPGRENGMQASKRGGKYLLGREKRNPGKQKSIGVKKSTKFFIRDTMVS